MPIDPITIAVVIGGILILVVVVVSILSAQARKKAEHLSALARNTDEQRKKDQIYAKYGQTEIAERILNNTVWVGETAEQLRDSFGSPLDIDVKVLKTKKI